MTKFLKYIAIVLLSSSFVFTSRNKIRDDGIYIYDNGLDSIALMPEMLELARTMSKVNGETFEGEPMECMPKGINVVNTEYTTELSFLYFSSHDSIFYTSLVCREKKQIDISIKKIFTNRAQYYLHPEQADLSTGSNILYKENKVSFETGVKSGYSHTKFLGHIYQDSITFELQWPFYPIFNSTKDSYRFRTLYFYSFSAIDSMLKSTPQNGKLYFKLRVL